MLLKENSRKITCLRRNLSRVGEEGGEWRRAGFVARAGIPRLGTGNTRLPASPHRAPLPPARIPVLSHFHCSRRRGRSPRRVQIMEPVLRVGRTHRPAHRTPINTFNLSVNDIHKYTCKFSEPISYPC